MEKIFNLIYNNKWSEVNDALILDEDIDVNMKDDNNKYMINYAIVSNKIETVSILINKGAKLDILDNDGRTLLYIPIEFKYNKLFELLLFFNKSAIGISLVDHPDNVGRIALHYAISSKNLKFAEMLLDEKSNTNHHDNSGINSLILAIKTESIEMCKLLIKYKVDINYRKVESGETALHFACSQRNHDLAKLLLDEGANPDIQDIDNEYAPLDYSISLNDKEMIKLLLEYGASVNLQDYYGNSILHNIIKNGLYGLLDIVMTDKINVNLYNIDLRLPIHLVLDKTKKIDSDRLKFFIANSDLNFQDADGFSPLHLLVQDNLWKKYRNILMTKQLDIFARTKDGKSVVDMVKLNHASSGSNDVEDFLSMVVESYLYTLQNVGHVWGNEWENECKKKEESDKCRKLIYDKLKQNIMDYRKCVTSYPTRVLEKCVSVRSDDTVDYCKFTGVSLDVLLGLVYLLQKHSISCSVLAKDGETKEFEHINFEIVWVDKKLHISKHFGENLQKCIKHGKKFVIIPLGIELDSGNHANYIIYDALSMEAERFEPYGYKTPYRFDYDPDMLDDELHKKFKEVDSKIGYIRPKDYMPKIGFQILDAIEENTSKIGDPGGFCALWSIWYTDMRLTYHDIGRSELIKELIRDIKTNNVSFKNVIRNYSKKIVKVRDNIFDIAGITINDWLNNKISKEQYLIITTHVNILVNSVTK